MKSINTAYAKYYNKRYGKIGYVFNDRYHSEPVENVKYFLICLRYIHQNPVKALVCTKIYNYKFTSIHAYRRKEGIILILLIQNILMTNLIKMNFLNGQKWRTTISVWKFFVTK